VAVLQCLLCVCAAHSITNGQAEVGLHGDQARLEAFGTRPLDPSQPDFDMLVHIRGVIQLLPLTHTSR
jgi:hypothetical protein